MKKSVMQPFLFCLFLGSLFVFACSQSEPPAPLDVGSNPDLSAHSAEFKQEVIKIRFHALYRRD